MSDPTSRSRVTITLGRTGQVVKRAGSALGSSFSDALPIVGSKRSVRERLGNNVVDGSSAHFNNKRLRGDGTTARALHDTHLSKDDLRHKITHKNILKQSQNIQQKGLDLRNILSRPAQSATNTTSTRNPIPEQKDTRLRYLEQNNSIRIANVPCFRAIDTVTKAESPWTLDRLRRRSPDEALATSRRDGELKKQYSVRTYDEPKNMSEDAFESSRPTSSSSYLTKTAPPIRLMKTMGPMVAVPQPLPSSLAQKSTNLVDDHLPVDSFLRALGLEKYAVLFKAEEVDMYSLKRMTEIDLKGMGLPMLWHKRRVNG
ncbi:hypothetical protein ACJIZ3_020241 [Penstemon smallii]|uniref:SAM domain-containing protein n=1 Tax=Penstemon smallii TaxID=265156 RepID=A0ABD3SIT0_9LAMI